MPNPQAYVHRVLGDTVPKLASLTDDVLLADIWQRPELSKRDRSLVTVAALIAAGNDQQLATHAAYALENGVTTTELQELIVQMAFYAGWPRAVSAASAISSAIQQPAATSGNQNTPRKGSAQ